MQDNTTKSTARSTAFLSYRSSGDSAAHLSASASYIHIGLYADRKKNVDGKNALPWRWRQRAAAINAERTL